MFERQLLIEQLDAAGLAHYSPGEGQAMAIYTIGGIVMVDHESKLWGLAQWDSVGSDEVHPVDMLAPLLEKFGYKFDESCTLGSKYWN